MGIKKVASEDIDSVVVLDSSGAIVDSFGGGAAENTDQSFTQSIVSLTTSSAQLIAAGSRTGLIITNCGTSTIYVHPGSEVPSSTDFTYQLAGGDAVEVTSLLASSAWRGVRASGTENVSILAIAP